MQVTQKQLAPLEGDFKPRPFTMLFIAADPVACVRSRWPKDPREPDRNIVGVVFVAAADPVAAERRTRKNSK